MLPGDSNENGASSRSNGTAAATSILLSPEIRSLSFANSKALVAWLSFWKVTKRYADEFPIFLELTLSRFPEWLCVFFAIPTDKPTCKEVAVQVLGAWDPHPTLGFLGEIYL